MKKDLHALLNDIPLSVNRLGANCFAEMKAYRLNRSDAEIVYVNNNLFNSGDTDFTRNGILKQKIADNLLVTLDQNRSDGSKAIRVFADRQSDPMNMSLNGNLGSGRAVYLGRCFNLKGIGRTILATSTDPNHSNGHLDLVSALWEAICANVIHTNLKTGSAPVLAVIDTKQKIRVPWRDGLYPGGFIIRVAQNGELDRPTHLFYHNMPVAAEKFKELIGQFGRQDAEKFIEQILHGCWSAGNISTGGHMIDYDTVFALRSRAPQWSYRPNWLSNFFGLEGDGQKKLLKAMINHPINHDRISCREAYRLFDEARKAHLLKRFYDLLGMDSEQPFVSHQVSPDEFVEMVSLFEELAMKMSANFKATAPWDEDNSSLNIFDFSNFLRYAPILLDTGALNETMGLELLRNSAMKLVESKVSGMPQSIEEIMRKRFVVSSPEQLQQLELKSLRFISIYKRLLSEYRESMPENWNRLILKAFIVNEERTYMNCRPGNDTLVALVQNLQDGQLSPEEFSLRIQTMIMACDRTLKKRLNAGYFSNIKLFMNGFKALLLSEKSSFQPVMAIFPDHSEHHASAEWKISIHEKLHICSISSFAEIIYITGPEMPLTDLYKRYSPEKTAFFRDGTEFKLAEIRR